MCTISRAVRNALAGAVLPAGLCAQALNAPPDADRGRSPVRMTRFGAAPVLDGALDDAVWAGAARLEGFVQTQPGDNIAPSRETMVLIGFDDRTLYLAIRAADDSSLVRATVAARDGIRADDNVSIVLDTFGDRRRAYVFAFNPLGIQQDGVYTEGASASDYSVDVVHRSAGRVDREGWTVEVAIPLSSIRYVAGASRRWHVQVQRRIKHLDDEQDSWMPLVRGAVGFLTQAGTLIGLEELPTRRAVELIPSVMGVQEGARVPVAGGEAFADARARADFGFSAKIGVTADVTGELAVNPDFAQVEADAPVVTANQRFPILFEEKRPFFLEGIELLRTPLLVVHTRAIVDPLTAVKLVGKRGATGFGVLAAIDEAAGRFGEAERRDPTMQAEIARLDGRRSALGVVRVRREVGAASTLGLLGTAYHFLDRDNVTAGADARLAAGARAVATLQLTGTWARRAFYDPDLGRDTLRDGMGLGYYVELRSTGRHLNLTLVGRGRSPDYVTETGFTPQVNVNTWSFETRWDAEPRPEATLVSWSAIHTVLAQVDWQGRLIYGYLWPRVTLVFPRLTSVTLGPYADYQRLFEEEFGPRRNATRAGAFAGPPERRTVWRGFAIVGATTPHRSWQFDGSVGWTWDTFDYDFGGGPRFPRVSPAALADPTAPLDPGTGRSFGGTLSTTWIPVPALRVSATHTRSFLKRSDTRRMAYDERLWSAQAVYQLSRFASIRVRTDYQWSRANVRPQVLLAWTPSPGTALYAGYNDDLNRNGYSPITGAPESGLRRNSRTVFLKLSYVVRWALP